MSDRHHAIDYIEFNVNDLEVAKHFYGEAFGWSFIDYGPQYVGIQDAAKAGAEAGGFNLGESYPGGSLILLYSDDFDASLEAVTTAGGKILNRPYEFPGGRRFHFSDPSGNELGVWTEH